MTVWSLHDDIRLPKTQMFVDAPRNLFPADYSCSLPTSLMTLRRCSLYAACLSAGPRGTAVVTIVIAATPLGRTQPSCGSASNKQPTVPTMLPAVSPGHVRPVASGRSSREAPPYETRRVLAAGHLSTRSHHLSLYKLDNAKL